MDDADSEKLAEAVEAEAAAMGDQSDLAELSTATRMAEQLSCVVMNLRRALTPGKLGENHPLSATAQEEIDNAIVRSARSIAYLSDAIGPPEDD